MAATRAASDEQLRANLGRLAAELLAQGTTTFECKSGYGLTVADEARSVALAAEFTPEVTYLGAHVVPARVRRRRGRLRRPGLRRHAHGLRAARPVGRRVLRAGRVRRRRGPRRAGRRAAAGLLPRVHANQLGPGPGIQVAVAAGAASADHCTYASDADVAALAGGGTVATLLPGVEFSTRQPYPDARRLLGAGVTVAIATDCNPGSCFTSSMPLCIALAVREMRMTTGGSGLGRDGGRRRGRCAAPTSATSGAGARADVVMLAAPSHAYLAYRPGVPLVAAVWQRGQRVV